MPSKPPPPPTPSPDRPDRPAGSAPRRVDSRDLFGEASVVLIAHEGETYSLRRTRLGRLILTK